MDAVSSAIALVELRRVGEEGTGRALLVEALKKRKTEDAWVVLLEENTLKRLPTQFWLKSGHLVILHGE